MDWSKLGVATGLPIDSDGTKDCHQFLSADSHNLYFNIFYAPLDPPDCLKYRKDDYFVAEEFVEKMCAKTPDSIDEFKEIMQLQNKLMSTIRPHGKKGYKIGQPAKTIQFVFKHDKNYKKTGFDIKPVLGLITEKKTYQQAEDDIFANKPNYILSQWFDYYAANYVTTEKQLNSKLSYSKILSDIGMDVCRNVAKMAFKRNIDCVCRVDPVTGVYLEQISENEPEHFLKTKIPLDQTRRYKSVLKQNSRPTKNPFILKNTVAPITASRKDVDYWNLREVARIFDQNSIETMPIGVSTAFANYKRHIITGQKLGFLCA